jgi:hypothetical protein
MRRQDCRCSPPEYKRIIRKTFLSMLACQAAFSPTLSQCERVGVIQPDSRLLRVLVTDVWGRPGEAFGFLFFARGDETEQIAVGLGTEGFRASHCRSRPRRQVGPTMSSPTTDKLLGNTGLLGKAITDAGVECVMRSGTRRPANGRHPPVEVASNQIAISRGTAARRWSEPAIEYIAVCRRAAARSAFVELLRGPWRRQCATPAWAKWSPHARFRKIDVLPPI